MSASAESIVLAPAAGDLRLLLALPIARFRLRLAAPESWRGARGTAWRGAFGHALRNRLCARAASDCASCPPEAGCRFALFFPAASQHKAQSAEESQIAPFILDDTSAAGSAQLVCTVLGPGVMHAGNVLAALGEAANMGIGPQRTHLRVAAVEQESPVGSDRWTGLSSNAVTRIAEPPPMPERFAMRIETPLRLRRKGDNLTPSTLTFADLTASLLRRASALLAQSPGCAPAQLDYRALAERARDIGWMDKKLRWQEFERRSDRQRADMTLGGIVGNVSVAGAALAEFWPLLWLGQWLHAGKGASFGFGRYRILPTA